MKKVTIRDVARMAGVVPSTVSFVLNKTANQSISEATREKVMAAARALNYRPNYMAANMRSNLSKTIGIVASYNVYSMYFTDMVTGVLQVAQQEGYGVLLCGNGRNIQENQDYLRHFLSNRIDGLLFLSSAHSEQKAQEEAYIQSFNQHKIPFVTVYGYTNEPEKAYMNIDFYQCGNESCHHLIEKGCKKIAYIAPLDKDNVTSYAPKTELDKQQGYQDAMQAAFGHQGDIFYFPRDFKAVDYPGILKRIETMVKQDGYDGFVACWATFGMQILVAAATLELQVPQDFRLISLDTVPYLAHTYPSLSSMVLPFFEIAQRATEILIHHYLKEDMVGYRPGVTFLPCRLQERESSGSWGQEET